MIMKLVMTDNRVLMAILVIASIGGTYAVMNSFDLTNLSSQNSLNPGGAFLTGNVKVIQYDEGGNVIAYRQTDNHIVKEGMEIIMAQVFRGINTTTNYPASPTLGLPHPVQFMQIGVGGEHRLLHNNTDIAEVAACTIRKSATITNSSTQGAHGYPGTCNDLGILCSAQMNVTAVANFEGNVATDNCADNSIDEAGIYDNSTATTLGMYDGGGPNGPGYMFARNTFGAVNLGPLDTLQLQWEFTFTDS